jgi:hypothetical protein
MNLRRGAFELLAADRVKRGIGNLGSPVVQAELDPWLGSRASSCSFTTTSPA